MFIRGRGLEDPRAAVQSTPLPPQFQPSVHVPIATVLGLYKSADQTATVRSSDRLKPHDIAADNPGKIIRISANALRDRDECLFRYTKEHSWEIVDVKKIGFVMLFGPSAVAFIVATAAQAGPRYLPTSDLVAALADGRSWNMVAADGKKGVVRFDRDGTGAIERPIRRPIRWKADAERFCMQMGFILGTKCFQAVATADGFQGFAGGKPSVRFSR